MSEEKPIAKTFIVCGVVIEQDGKFLLIQEKKPEVYGKWNLPGGRVDEGESLEQAAIREAKEECGLDVEIEKELLILHSATSNPIIHAYKARITGGKVAYSKDDVLDAKWFTYEEVKSMEDKLRTPEYSLGAIEESLK